MKENNIQWMEIKLNLLNNTILPEFIKKKTFSNNCGKQWGFFMSNNW